MKGSSFFNRALRASRLVIVIASVLVSMPSAFSSEAKALQSSAREACSQVLAVNQDTFVPVKLGNLDGRKTSSVTVLELTQRIPRKAKKAFEEGIKALRDYRLEAAKQYLMEALAIDPNYFQAATILANLLFNAKEYPASRMYAERALSVNPEYPPALEILGALDVLDGQWLQGVSELTAIVRYSPFRSAAHYYLAVALSHLGQCKESSRHLEMAAYLRSQPVASRRRPIILESFPALAVPPGHSGGHP